MVEGGEKLSGVHSFNQKGQADRLSCVLHPTNSTVNSDTKVPREQAEDSNSSLTNSEEFATKTDVLRDLAYLLKRRVSMSFQ